MAASKGEDLNVKKQEENAVENGILLFPTRKPTSRPMINSHSTAGSRSIVLIHKLGWYNHQTDTLVVALIAGVGSGIPAHIFAYIRDLFQPIAL
jgi:hypothetical protein